MRNKFYKTDVTDCKVLGVCGGLARYFNLDSLIIRVVVLMLFLCYGIGLLPYIILGLLADSEHDMDTGNDRNEFKNVGKHL